MKPIYICEADVHALLDMRAAIAALEDAFLEQAAGHAQNAPRSRARYWGSRLNVMSAGLRSGRFGFKAYAGTQAPTVYHVLLYDAAQGLVAIIEARRLSRLRTGAATGLATDKLAPVRPLNVAIIGAGEQAPTQLVAISAVREISSIRAYSRNKENLLSFCARMSAELGLTVVPASTAEACVRDADVIVTATDSDTPVLRDAWLPANALVNTIGANAANRMELALETFARASIVATDDLDQARLEAGEIIRCVENGRMHWDAVTPLAQLVAAPPHQQNGLRIFKSLGAALEDVAVASRVYDLAVAQGRGIPL